MCGNFVCGCLNAKWQRLYAQKLACDRLVELHTRTHKVSHTKL